MIVWCNENQGFVSALLALSSVLVAVIALFISIKTSKKQNKIQIDLQARQIKLDSFQLRYECWVALQFLDCLIVLSKNWLSSFNEDNKNQCIADLQNILFNLKYSYKIESHRSLYKMLFVFKYNINKLMHYYVTIETCLERVFFNKEEYQREFFIALEEIVTYEKVIIKLLEELSEDLDISQLHKINSLENEKVL